MNIKAINTPHRAQVFTVIEQAGLTRRVRTYYQCPNCRYMLRKAPRCPDCGQAISNYLSRMVTKTNTKKEQAIK